MRARERVARCVMIERRRRPSRRRVARTTVVAEVPRRVVRVRRLHKLRLVTLVAIVEGKLVIVVRMTRLALRRRVCASQWETRKVVIERSPLPRCGCMALSAIVTIVARNMVRVVCVSKIIRMTLKAGQRKILKLIVHMASRACRGRVRTCQSEPGGVVIECRRSPCHRGVACAAVC